MMRENKWREKLRGNRGRGMRETEQPRGNKGRGRGMKETKRNQTGEREGDDRNLEKSNKGRERG